VWGRRAQPACLRSIPRIYPRSFSGPHLVARSPRARGICRMLRICGQWYCGQSFMRFCVKGHMIFAGSCGEGCQFRQVVRVGRFTGLPYSAAARSGALSCAPAFPRFWRDGFEVNEDLGVYIVKRVWVLFQLPRILWSGNICGGLAQGRKPHGGSEGPCIWPLLTFLRGGGPMPLG